MKRFVMAAALLAALGGCTSGGDGGDGLAAVHPSQVTVEALRAAADPASRAFYEGRDWRPAWTAGNAAQLIAAIGGAGRHGLARRMFLDGVEQASAPAAREAALTRAALAYAGALARGRIDPTRLGRPYTVPRPDPDLAEGLDRAVAEGNVADWLAGLAPQDDEYQRLADAYTAAAAQAVQAHRRAPIPDGRPIRPGEADPRVPAIAAALAADGYYTPEGAAPERLTEGLVAAVRRVQDTYGLTANGVVEDDTLAAINEGAFERARALAVNLERRRWLAREAPDTRIDVNIAAATLAYWRGGDVADRRRVVVGQPGHETPELGSPLYRLVANPTWTVPRSIQTAEIAPRGAGYMRRNHMSWQDGWIVQASGPTNSLGLVKFDLRNDLAIYLHDTPAKTLFERDDRHASHGCVRVQDALGFAAALAGEQGVRAEWDRARAGGDEAFVPLARPIPVRLMYQTAFIEAGQVRYRLDVYGWDDAVARALGLPARPSLRPRRAVEDMGP